DFIVAHGVSKPRSLWCEQSKVIVHGVSKPREPITKPYACLRRKFLVSSQSMLSRSEMFTIPCIVV
ncbi:hypothetical protein J6590_088368, partial [Homalodisca vitripennis]